jgi:hypothetical protein
MSGTTTGSDQTPCDGRAVVAGDLLRERDGRAAERREDEVARSLTTAARHAVLLIMLTLTGCTPSPDGSGQAPTAPYQQQDPRDTSGMH